MRKRDKSPQNKRRITFRLSDSEWQDLEQLLKKSDCRTVSMLIRKSLFSGMVRVITYDRSLDKVMEELSAVREEIRSIGVNINQVTKKLNQSSTAESRIYSVMEITKLYQQTEQKVTELLVMVSNLSRRWLPE